MLTSSSLRNFPWDLGDRNSFISISIEWMECNLRKEGQRNFLTLQHLPLYGMEQEGGNHQRFALYRHRVYNISTSLIGIELIKLNWFGVRISLGIPAEHCRERCLRGFQGQTERQNKTNSHTGSKYWHHCSETTPTGRGTSRGLESTQLGCGHWGRYLDAPSRAQRRHEKLSHRAADAWDAGCGGELMISYRLITAWGFPRKAQKMLH